GRFASAAAPVVETRAATNARLSAVATAMRVRLIELISQLPLLYRRGHTVADGAAAGKCPMALVSACGGKRAAGAA
ncbi:MAG: hypothetical protein U9O18_07590, partial [Chloroflexota bacterium]|nr:hypothetical protein [Chloroflexota bacterium]